MGIFLSSAYFLSTEESKSDFYLRELREMHQELSRRIADKLEFTEDVHVIPNYS